MIPFIIVITLALLVATAVGALCATLLAMLVVTYTRGLTPVLSVLGIALSCACCPGTSYAGAADRTQDVARTIVTE